MWLNVNQRGRHPCVSSSSRQCRLGNFDTLKYFILQGYCVVLLLELVSGERAIDPEGVAILGATLDSIRKMSTTCQWEMVTSILWSFGWEFWAGIVLTVGVICVSCVWFLYTRNDELLTSRKINIEQRLGDDKINDSILEPKHKIFLSHSGKQKEFVEYLCTALESRCRYPFFDKRHSSLSKGEKFANMIFEAIEQCDMMVVVISDEYFMSKWPMMELHAFVQAIKAMKKRGCESRQKYILPLFYKLSVKEFRDKKRQKKWVKKWKSLAKDDGRRGQIDVKAWKKAVDELGTYDGISYSRELQEIKAYEKEVVTNICEKISADVKWDDSQVQGKSNICKVLRESIASVGCSKVYGCKIVGIFGVGGIGKTTICKVLCNELSIEYEERVCHIELETQARASSSVQSQATTSIVVESLRKLVILLTDKNSEFVQKLDEGQCKDIMRSNRTSRRTFIAIDNVWDNDTSIMHAKTILGASSFHKESLVIVTARSRDTLELLGICGDACIEMPELTEADAGRLFVFHAARGTHFVGEEEERDIMRCIKRCYFRKGGGTKFHYHPLALQSLGLQASYVGKKPSEWVEKLSIMRNFNFLERGNSVFDILRSSFDLLQSHEQSLFMDLVVYRPFLAYRRCDFTYRWAEMVEWLCLVHRVNEDKIKSWLDGLKRKGVLHGIDWISGKINLHDLYMEFALLESEGMLDKSIDFEDRRYTRTSMSDLTELERSPSGGCWHKLTRVSIHDIKGKQGVNDQIISLQGINWLFYSNVVVLELEGLTFIRESLNLKGLTCVRSVAMFNIVGLNRLEGLDGLKNLAFFKWHRFGRPNDPYPSIVGQLPSSLKVFVVDDVICLDFDILVRCSNLVTLKLESIQAAELDLSSCSKLQTMKLESIKKLQLVRLPCNSRGVCGLKSLEVRYCKKLVEIPELDELIGLEQLVVLVCPRYQLPDLRNLTALQVLELAGGKAVVGCCIPQQLRELKYWCYESNRPPSLRGCKQLEVLDMRFLRGGKVGQETNLEDLEDLPALRHLKLDFCRLLSGWPDLSKSRKLEVIHIFVNAGECEVELQEDDIRMLVSLPLLQPLEIVEILLPRPIVKLDLRKRKVLRSNRSPSEISECDIDDVPPIKLERLWKF